MNKPIYDSYKLFIDGHWVYAEDKRTFNTFCPANGEKLAICSEASANDVDRAVQSSWIAFHDWKKTSIQERSAALNKIADAIEDNAEKLALIETLDVGKPIRET